MEKEFNDNPLIIDVKKILSEQNNLKEEVKNIAEEKVQLKLKIEELEAKAKKSRNDLKTVETERDKLKEKLYEEGEINQKLSMKNTEDFYGYIAVLQKLKIQKNEVEKERIRMTKEIDMLKEKSRFSELFQLKKNNQLKKDLAEAETLIENLRKKATEDLTETKLQEAKLKTVRILIRKTSTF